MFVPVQEINFNYNLNQKIINLQSKSNENNTTIDIIDGKCISPSKLQHQIIYSRNPWGYFKVWGRNQAICILVDLDRQRSSHCRIYKILSKLPQTFKKLILVGEQIGCRFNCLR
jgi:hypothetical protein